AGATLGPGTEDPGPESGGAVWERMPRATIIAAAAGIICGAVLFAVWVLAIRSPLSPSPLARAPEAGRTEAGTPASPTSAGALFPPVASAPAAAAEAPPTAASAPAPAPISTAPPGGRETAGSATFNGPGSAPPSTAASTALAEQIKQAMEAIIPG